MRTPSTVLLTLALVLSIVMPSIVPVAGGAAALPAAPPTSSPAAGSASPNSALPNVEIRVNAGGPDYTDSLGQLWLADKAYAPGSWGYSAGTSYSTTQSVAGTPDPALYQSQHSGVSQYRFDVPNDIYLVQLGFAEIYCTTNCRSFNVKIEGQQFLTNFAPFTIVGSRRALNVTYLVPVTDTQLTIDLLFVSGREPIVNLLRVTGSAGAPQRNTMRINAGGFDYKDTSGNLWTADQKYMAGGWGYTDPAPPKATSGIFKTTNPITGTTEPALFQDNRYGMSGYVFDLPNGAYRVDLLFAETFSSIYAAGQRVFDVSIEDSVMIPNMDVIARTITRDRALTIPITVTVIDSQLNIGFTAKTAQPPIINAVAVTPLDSDNPGPWTNFAPTGWQNTQTPAASASVSDSMAGLNVASGQFAFSSNGGSTFSGWQAASTSGANGTTDPQTVLAAAVPFNQDSATQNRVKFRISDMSGNIGESGVYTVAVDALPPASLITSPSAGGLVAGPTVAITGTATDAASGVQQVEFSSDGGSSWHTASGANPWTYSWFVSGDGVYNLRSRGRDVVGHVETPGSGITVTVDSVPPVTFIRTPQAGQTISSTTYLITGTAFDATSGLARVELSTDGGASWVTASGTSSWSYNWTPASQGAVTIRARAVDRAGNVDNPGTALMVVIDRLAPTSTIVDPAPGRVIRGPQYVISGSASDDAQGAGLAVVEVSVDGSSWAAASGLGTWLYTWNPLPPDGAYTVRSRARDQAGNVQTPPASSSITVDNVAPVSVASANGTLGSAGWYISPVSIDILASDATSGVRAIYYRLDASDWITYTGAIALSSNGNHTLVYYAVDNGNNAESNHTLNLKLDALAPATTATITGPGSLASWFRGPVNAALAALDANSGVHGTNWSLDGSPWAVYTTSLMIATDGAHVLQFYSTDNAGNSESIQHANPRIDSTPPVITMTSPLPGGAISGTTYLIAGTCSDGSGSGITNIEVSIDGGAWAAATGGTTWTFPWSSTSPGAHNIRTRATDAAGNVSDPGSGAYVTVDNTRPDSSIANPYDGQIVHGPAVIVTGATSDTYSGVARVEVSTNGGASWSPATLLDGNAFSFTWVVANDGIFTLRSRATDRAGNVEVPDLGISVQVDSISPGSSITAPTAGQYMHGAAFLITGHASDIGSGVKRVEVSIDNGPWNLADGAADWSYAWSPLAPDGQHTIRSRATDNAGNVESPGAGVDVTVDNGKPVTNIITPANGAVITAEVVLITGASSDSTSAITRVEVSIRRVVDGAYWDGSGWATSETWLATDGVPSAWSYEWTDLPMVGMFTIRARATDNLDNVEVPGAGATVLLQRGLMFYVPIIIND